MDQVLTPSEKIQYLKFGTLPSRVYFSGSNRAYMVKGNEGRIDLGRQRGNTGGQNQHYMPRWRYWLSTLPFGNIFNTGDYPENGFRGLDDNKDNGTDDNNNKAGNSDDKDSTNDKDGNAGSKDDKKDDEKDDGNEGNKDHKKDDKNDDNNEGKKDDKKDDNNEGGMINDVLNSTPVELMGDALRGDTAEFVKDAVTSDTGQEVIKFGIGLLPGGSAMIQAYEAGKKINDATGLAGKVGNKLKLA